MSNGNAGTTIERIAEFLAGSLRPLLATLDTSDATGAPMRRFVEALGWSVPEPLPQALLDLRPTIVSLVRNVGALSDLRAGATEGETPDEVELAAALALVLSDVTVLTSKLAQLKSDLGAQLPAAYLTATHIDRDFPTRLLDALLITAAYKRAPLVGRILRLFGIIEISRQDADPAAFQPAYTLRRIRWDRIPQLLQAPDQVLRDVYGWGTPKIDLEPLIDALQGISAALNAPGSVNYPSRGLMQAVAPTLDLTGRRFDRVFEMPIIDLGIVRVDLGVTSIPKATATELQGIAVALVASGSTAELTIPLNEHLQLVITGTLDASTGIALAIRPDQPPAVVTDFNASRLPINGAGLASRLEYSRHGAEAALPILSIPGGTGVEVRGAYVGASVAARINAPIDIGAEGGVTDARIVIRAGEADSFLAKLLPEDGIEVPFEFAIGWSTTRGVYFQGSAGLETTLAVHLSLGPLLIESIHLAALLEAEGLAIEASVNASATLGPIAAAVERIGMSADLAFSPGNLGPLDLDFGFKPPNGLGILVDAGAVTGGGFLTFDFDNGRYAGILQLQIYAVSLTAIGLLDTKLPGGKPGFSFLIIITAKFPPIQLGFGFTLNGAGGMAGINRTIVVDALQAGVRSGAVDYLLFPEDPIRDAAIIISDLRTFFPPVEGRYLFGPIALIGYGTPTLVDVELGIIIEVPSPVRLILLGQLNAFLPQPDAAVVELHVDVLGVIDFGAKRMSIDATLRDSRVAAFSLYGDMAMRLAWGDQPSFALAVGGWNPHFTPPAGFPELRRLTIALGDGENPRITLKGYFALTSNSAQVGARAELYAAKGGFNISGWIGFDAIFIFDPFSFRTDFSAGVALKRGNSTIASIHLDATLTGTSPYHAWGKASFSVLFFSVSVPFDAKFGATKTIAPPERDPWELLEPAIQEQQNWTAELPPGAFPVVSLRAPPVGAPRVVLDPVGSATLRQKVVPLDFTISKFGEATPLGPDHYTVTQVTVQGTATTAYSDVEDLFARGQFRRLSDHQKLTLPSFEPLIAGIRLTASSVTLGAPQGRNVVFETIILDSEYESRPQPRYSVPLRQQRAATAIGAAALSDLSSTGLGKFAPDPGLGAPFTLDDETYVVASTDDLTPNSAITGPTTMGRAYDALDEYLAEHPEERGVYQVVALEEVMAAA